MRPDQTRRALPTPQVGGVFVRVFNERARLGASAAGTAALAGAPGGGPGGAAAVPADPAGFCKVGSWLA